MRKQWPLSTCNTCDCIEDWRDMHANKVWEEGPAGRFFTYVRTCIPCFANARDVTEQEAVALMIEESPGFRSKERRAAKFAKAREDAREKFECLTSYKELRDMTVRMMEGLFADFIDIFAIKAGHLDSLDEKLAEQKELIKQIKTAKTAEQAR